MSDDGVCYSHFRSLSEADGTVLPNAGATLAYKEIDGKIVGALAFCHPNDNFNYRLGRVKAKGQLTRLLIKPDLNDNDRFFSFNSTDRGLWLSFIGTHLVNNMGYTGHGKKASARRSA